MSRQYFVYILTNARNTVLYIGVTNNLLRRVWEHKNSFVEGFAKRYRVSRLVYYEECGDVVGAVAREKQIKAGSRLDKVLLIESMNRDRYDLYDKLS